MKITIWTDKKQVYEDVVIFRRERDYYEIVMANHRFLSFSKIRKEDIKAVQYN